MRTGRGTLSVAAGLVLVVLASVGYVLPPAFDPPPLKVDPAFEAIPPQPSHELRPVVAVDPIRRQEISLPAEGQRLDGTLRVPTTPGRHPAMVFVSGSGNGSRTEFTPQAEFLAKAGVVTIAFDKRTVGYDFRERDFGLLADDALRMVEYLRTRPEVDPARVGVWGVSEGGWVVPIAAAKSAAVGFIVLVSSPNVSPLRQVAWALNEQLLRLRAPIGARDLLTRAMGGVGFDFLRYDALPALSQIKQPVLAFYGTTDPSIPFVESTQALVTSLGKAGNDHYTIRFMANGDHAMRVAGGDFTAGYLETLASWIIGLPGTGRPSVHMAGATPVQRFEASDVPAAPWYAGGTMLGLTICLAAVGYVAGPVAAMVVRLRGRPRTPVETNARLWPPIRRRLVRMAWTSLGLLASVVAFITLLVLFSVNQAGAWPAVLAGWLLIRVLAVLMLIQEVTAVAAFVSALREGMRPSRWQHVAVAGVLGGTGLLMVAAAYYGLFSFPW
ncbi:prolyl oligopeptidase family serine peptidase [Nonomuraea sp. K274]|uniref:Prolyl oligopeptidase family serine peptidase n=1 Tax=Nonomuraea cypriaca TaxID=1187855 RepID=A0A931AD46_9ACTN|nr:prolyl oligopeptidase family serine peptidase [Nonomuraea cypriaca]MBF8190651.1 prolyl oligopeptidase family serine peptidase [Nonomuraea cypriaca]